MHDCLFPPRILMPSEDDPLRLLTAKDANQFTPIHVKGRAGRGGTIGEFTRPRR